MLLGLICVFSGSSSRPESPLLCHPYKYMGGSPRAKKLCFAEKFSVLLIHIVSCDGRARKCNFYRPSPLTQIASRRKIREKDVRTTANYGPFLAPMIVGRWDVVFLARMRIIRISLRRVWVSRKSVFFAKSGRFVDSILSICDGFGAHLRVLADFSGRHPQL